MSDRNCGGCGMCCKLLDIDTEEFRKPRNTWCPHALRGRGCGIYETRPSVCREFRCNWLRMPNLDDSWRPDRCGFIVWDTDQKTLLIAVEPGKADAWKRQPYYRQIKDWSKTALTGDGIVLVTVRDQTTVVLPHADVPIGVVPNHHIRVGSEQAGLLRKVFVVVTSPDGAVRRYDT